MSIFILTIGLFVLFLVLLISGIVKQKRKLIYFSLLALLLSIGGGLYIGVIIAKKAYTVIKDAKNPFAKRTGLEIYTALFDAPEASCVRVTNSMDQVVPRLDCCIWLEFSTCPGELRRIIDKKQLTPFLKEGDSRGDVPAKVITEINVPAYGPKPAWFKLQNLGEGCKALRKYPIDPNHDLILYFSKDSTHALYCDMAD
ncbi:MULTISPECIES: hypothetical protein [Niastella]|uniref:Uncharacterized protein n=1 Tax=Niastella soli TaxID=2821487 RepID=A0ABS3YQM8_9BACT|nr:hypothetical protein [Niastella soli]MBO9200190.1 hypothetical protein [Niastella soli]